MSDSSCFVESLGGQCVSMSVRCLQGSFRSPKGQWGLWVSDTQRALEMQTQAFRWAWGRWAWVSALFLVRQGQGKGTKTLASPPPRGWDQARGEFRVPHRGSLERGGAPRFPDALRRHPAWSPDACRPGAAGVAGTVDSECRGTVQAITQVAPSLSEKPSFPRAGLSGSPARTPEDITTRSGGTGPSEVTHG